MVSTDNKQFQYEVQDYQENCVQNIVSIFERLYWKENFKQVMSEHYKNHSYNFPNSGYKKYRYNDGNRNGKNLYFH